MVHFVKRHCKARHSTLILAALTLAGATIVLLGDGCSLGTTYIHECEDAGSQGGGGSGGADASCK